VILDRQTKSEDDARGVRSLNAQTGSLTAEREPRNCNLMPPALHAERLRSGDAEQPMPSIDGSAFTRAKESAIGKLQ
jgi:hypothetical protein